MCLTKDPLGVTDRAFINAQRQAGSSRNTFQMWPNYGGQQDHFN